ncbi:MAG: Ferrochelatase [Chlamydiales bacterium]|nr:Ferrochelatase [Chlamydiales bacterium]MCH9619720.1 Ferrochelatase [Chlamydiales bacterium]MCH9623326.1 Ferrochelatase [Chlamydiales bacterium]
MKKTAYLIANFGGPRNLKEVEPFLRALLTDRDVIRTKLPKVISYPLFSNVARKRAKKVCKDYELIGGGSPIFSDTEAIAKELRAKLDAPILTFHRYLPSTHAQFLKQMEQLECDEIRIFPMFPQFTYATTGSIARFFKRHLSSKVVKKIRWIKSYPTHPAYIKVIQKMIREFFVSNGLKEEETFLLFSAHGLPKSFISEGDVYLDECFSSYDEVRRAFPKAEAMLAFQSQFGPEEWVRPYTLEVCEQFKSCKSNVIFVPISFTSDHIETLFEIEQDYIPLIRQKGFSAYRLDAMNLRKDWLEAISEILSEVTPVSNQMLVRS